jgi:hypothetical protein
MERTTVWKKENAGAHEIKIMESASVSQGWQNQVCQTSSEPSNLGQEFVSRKTGPVLGCRSIISIAFYKSVTKLIKTAQLLVISQSQNS